MAPERSYGRIAGLSAHRRAGRHRDRGLAAGPPADEYVLLPDDPHPADAVVSVGGAQADALARRPGIYYLDVLVHRASVTESWLARFEDGATVVPADAVVPPGGDRPTSTASTASTFADSRIVAGVVALRALGRKVTVERTGVTSRRRPRRPAWRAGSAPGMVITAVDGVAARSSRPCARRWSARSPGRRSGCPVLDGKRTHEPR